MSELSSIHIPSAPAWQRRRLALWLKEWELDRLLPAAPMPGPHGTPCGEVPHRTAATARPPPAPGQIRLLYPVPGRASAQRPIYVAILEKRKDESFLVAPFGRFAEPALPGEWRTGLRAMPLRVLCVWNCRVVSAETLNLSWLAGRLPPGKTQQAREIYDHFYGGAPLATVSAKDLGPPLRHPLDPRFAYLAEETEALEENLPDSIAEPTSLSGRAGLSYDEVPGEQLLAAESRAAYGPKAKRRKKDRR